MDIYMYYYPRNPRNSNVTTVCYLNIIGIQQGREILNKIN